MLRHLLRTVWYRKKANGLILAELVIAFLVLFAVLSTYIFFANVYHKPLGFDYRNIWVVRIDRGGEWRPEMASAIQKLVHSARELEPVMYCEPMGMVPYGGSTWTSSAVTPNGEIPAIHNRAGDGVGKLFDVNLLSGRWFGPEDDRDQWRPIVINQAMASAMFGSRDPIGQAFDALDTEDSRDRTVIGVIDDFRQHGEFIQPTLTVIERYRLSESTESSIRNLLVKLRPRTEASFEVQLVKQLQAVEPNWRYTIEPLDVMREDSLKSFLIPLATVGVVAGFMLMMVALGIFGVLWQSVTQRRREIGLKRALGATKQNVRWHITLELLTLTGFASLIGTAIAVQVPLTGKLGFVANSVYLMGLVAATSTMLLMTFVCTLYPSWLSSRIQPAEALHYE